MFNAIIHNLQPGDKGFDAAQRYNALIGKKPKGNNMSLAEKIEAQRKWRDDCIALLAQFMAA